MTIERQVPQLKYGDSPIFVYDVVNYLEQITQLHCQHALIKSGLVVGDEGDRVRGILICLDITEPVLDEAVERGCNFLIVHHPFCLQPLTKVTSGSYGGKYLAKAIQCGLSIYVFSTNLDECGDGASDNMAKLLELQNIKPIVPKKSLLCKLTTFVPVCIKQTFIDALCRTGAVLATHNLAGYVSSTTVGIHYLRDPGTPVHLNGEGRGDEEHQLTFIIPSYSRESIIQTLLQFHPYERLVYYVEEVEVSTDNVGSGVCGMLSIPLPAKYFLKYIKTKLALPYLQHTHYANQNIKTVAIYTGEGGWLLKELLNEHKSVDAFITAGLQYEHFLEASGKIVIVDVGYYAIRVGIKPLILSLLLKEFNNIAILCCEAVTNPIYYIND